MALAHVRRLAQGPESQRFARHRDLLESRRLDEPVIKQAMYLAQWELGALKDTESACIVLGAATAERGVGRVDRCLRLTLQVLRRSDAQRWRPAAGNHTAHPMGVLRTRTQNWFHRV